MNADRLGTGVQEVQLMMTASIWKADLHPFSLVLRRMGCPFEMGKLPCIEQVEML